MANLKISELTLATNPTGEELLVAVQGDTTKKIKINQVLNYITPTSLTVSDGETVDLGSGSIALACHNLGYDLTACELDKEYYNDAMKRIEQHKAQIRMF